MPALRVYTIEPEHSFVDALAAGILQQTGERPEDLTRVRILLPNRRACRALALAFLRSSRSRPLLLPRMMPFGDVDEDDLGFAETDGGAAAAALDIPPAIPPMRRQLLLTRLVTAAYDRKIPHEQAIRLARELGRLIDQGHIEGLDFGRLADLVEDELAEHWQVTLRFLQTVLSRWPEVLSDEGFIDPADRRNRLLYAQAALWREHPPREKTIAAGSTGSIPATAALIKVVASLPDGAVVLPGLDIHAADAEWQAIIADPIHPQHGLAKLLAGLEVDRRSVAFWPSVAVPGSSPERSALIRAALRPAACSDPSADRHLVTAAATAGLARLDAADAEGESRAIALILREALEESGRSAALVTADRGLARRVASELKRWSIDIDDSAGDPLAQTAPGVFLRLVARLAAGELAPLPLLTLLKHPLAAAGLAPSVCRARVRRLEVKARRGERHLPGFAGLQACLDDGDRDLAGLLRAVVAAMDPLLALYRGDVAPLGDLVTALIATAEGLVASDTAVGATRLWAGQAGEAAAGFVADLIEAASGDPSPMACEGFAPLLEELMAGTVVRPRYGQHPRLAIWGPLEARLQHADVMVLGGINEGSWPPDVPVNPWMSRPMMRRFGLQPPERRLGLSAHDFVQGCGARTVWLTRACRSEGTPTVPSRWLSRLDALLSGHPAAPASAGRGLDWQACLDRPLASTPIEVPMPRPPVGDRPRDLSATDVETWVRDPYALYAKRILRLKALEPIDPDPDVADYGRLVHQALETFVREHAGELPADAFERLLACGDRLFDAMPKGSGVRAFWWPRFLQIARWFIRAERQRRGEITASATEVSGLVVIEAIEGPFTIRARADRIDTRADGRLVIIDYKTGAPPTAKQVKAGFAPQLPIEAMIAGGHGFEAVAGDAVAALEYWQLKSTGGEIRSLEDWGREPLPAPPELAAETRRRLVALIGAFDQAETPYMPRPRPRFAPRFSDYEHLARIKEWSVPGAEDAE